MKKNEKHADLLKQIEEQQKIQMNNPHSSDAWQAASKRIHELVKEMTGNYPKDARGKQ